MIMHNTVANQSHSHVDFTLSPQVLEGNQRNRMLVFGNQMQIKAILMLAYTLTSNAMNKLTFYKQWLQTSFRRGPKKYIKLVSGNQLQITAILMLAYTLTSNAMNKVTDNTPHSTNNDYAQILERGPKE